MEEFLLQEGDTEAKILEAAKSVFISKGLEGTTMQEIANEAHISRTSLHYYYRNKDKLFNAVFSSSLDVFIPQLMEIIDAEQPVMWKAQCFVESYIDMLKQNPRLPGFILQEFSREPEKLIGAIKAKGIDLEKLGIQIMLEAQLGKIRAVSLPHFVINIISLCVFPFLAKPMLMEFFFEHNEALFEKFLNERKEEIMHQIRLSLAVDNNNNN